MSDVQGLIEEARSYVHPDSAHALYLLGALADALEAEVALREALRAKVNALADELDKEAAAAHARAVAPTDDDYTGYEDFDEQEDYLKRNAARRVRALIVQEDQKEHSDAS